MAQPAYFSFVGLALFVSVGVVLLARASTGAVRPVESVDDDAGLPVVRDRSLPTGALLLNVLLTQGVLAVVLVGAAWLAGIPWSALGVDFPIVGWELIGAGVGAGFGLYVVDEGLTVVVREVGLVPDELLRESLSPDSVGGWVTLLVGVLPVVAIAEELLFRAALIGVVTTGLGVPLWVAVGGSSLLFGAAHGAQGGGGIVVTGVLGVAIGVVFVVSGSLVVVIVAHYVVNGLEFVVHEWVGWSVLDGG